MKSSSIHSKIY